MGLQMLLLSPAGYRALEKWDLNSKSITKTNKCFLGFAVNPPGDFDFRGERVSPSSPPGWGLYCLKPLSREKRGCPVFSEASEKP